MNCDVCTEKFNKSSRVRVNCPLCPYKQCASCAETYILGHSSDPHCMNCKKGWSRETLHENFSNKFLNKTLKARREELLFERERSLMPETQPYVEVELKIRQCTQKTAEVHKEIAKVRKELDSIRHDTDIFTIESAIEKSRERLEKLKIIRGLECEILHHDYARSLWVNNGQRASSIKRQFVRSCPANGCNGFLSTSWKCGICDMWACPECHEVKGTERDAPHTCDPASVATALLLAKDSRNCPKCASLIFKINGCDQMWCTQCHTAFSWNTGQVETHRVHNPHYYDWMRQSGTLPREPGDEPCGGLPSIERFRELLGGWPGGRSHENRTTTQKILWNIHRIYTHVQWIVQGRYIAEDRVGGNRDLRVKFMLKDFTEEIFKQKLQQREKAREKKEAIRQVLDMYQTVTVDIFRNLLETKSCDTALESFTNLRNHANECFEKISNRFTKCSVPKIGENFECT
jgi:hypothetical protein